MKIEWKNIAVLFLIVIVAFLTIGSFIGKEQLSILEKYAWIPVSLAIIGMGGFFIYRVIKDNNVIGIRDGVRRGNVDEAFAYLAEILERRNKIIIHAERNIWELRKKIKQKRFLDIEYRTTRRYGFLLHPVKQPYPYEIWCIYFIMNNYLAVFLMEFTPKEVRDVYGEVIKVYERFKSDRIFEQINKYYLSGVPKTIGGIDLKEKIWSTLPEDAKEDPEIIEALSKTKEESKEETR